MTERKPGVCSRLTVFDLGDGVDSMGLLLSVTEESTVQ